MSFASYSPDSLLAPIYPERPCGMDLRSAPDWVRIQDARRSDDNENLGVWRPKELKEANWHRVRDLTASALVGKSKDLQLAIWYTEASIKLDGFAGLASGLHLIWELLSRYGTDGLYPEDDEIRAGLLGWLNQKLAELIHQVPLTARNAAGNYSYLHYQESKLVGKREVCRTWSGEVNVDKQLAYEAHLAEGHISEEMFREAVAATPRSHFQTLSDQTQDALAELTGLNVFIPDLISSSRALKQCVELLQAVIPQSREDYEVSSPAETAQAAEEPEANAPPVAEPRAGEVPAEHTWERAEYLVRIGMVERGLAEMGQIAASESTGRERFQRKLMLAETYLLHGRTNIAAAILEELAEQIDRFNLEAWESPNLIGRVWSQLYGCYRKAEPGTPEAARAQQILKNICRVSPWRALHWLS
jgi:type VI secretion system protein ImpA